ncbi:MAG: TetR/AcrR family transcriptional regulator [Bacteroidales bacterium]|nr:TetR/AcrR family transcriptional regulator [Bacteroidales bacterium]
MMTDLFKNILDRVREKAFTKELEKFTIKDLCKEFNVSEDTIRKYVRSEEDLVEKVLEFERESFREIFVTHDFEGVNAIDILLVVSKEIALRFKDVSPSFTFELRKRFPETYQKHFDNRIEFIFEKIKINLQKGISQGIYREDLSIELISRLYISRLIDLHNPDFFPPEKFSFETLFDTMFESLIRNISNEKGLKYYEKKKKAIKF